MAAAKNIKKKVYGLELHYKMKELKKDKDTVVLLAYVCIVHAMDLRPEEYPDDDKLNQLKF